METEQTSAVTKPRLSLHVFHGLELLATNPVIGLVLKGERPLSETELTETDIKCAMKARVWLEQMRAYRLARGRPLFDVAQSEQAARGA